MKIENKFAWSVLVVFSLCLSAVPASAGIIFSDFGPSGNLYETGNGYLVGKVPSQVATNPELTIAAPFTAATSGNVTEIDLAVTPREDAFQNFSASIWTDTLARQTAQGAFWPLGAT